jgi:hypothetical protein
MLHLRLREHQGDAPDVLLAAAQVAIKAVRQPSPGAADDDATDAVHAFRLKLLLARVRPTPRPDQSKDDDDDDGDREGDTGGPGLDTALSAVVNAIEVGYDAQAAWGGGR